MSSRDEIIYGLRSVIEAVHSGKEIEKIFLKKGLQGELFQELFVLIKNSSIPYQFVPSEKLNRLTGKNHQGVIAQVSPIVYHSIDQVVPAIYEKGEDPLILILDGITDVRNFGAVARTAECAGVHSIVIPFYGSAPVNADSMKTSAGALNLLPVCRDHDLAGVARYLKESGLKIYGATEKATTEYSEVDFSGPVVIVMGSEDKGISAGLLKLCDELIAVPVTGKISSLNVSAAAAVLIYEAVRQRRGND